MDGVRREQTGSGRGRAPRRLGHPREAPPLPAVREEGASSAPDSPELRSFLRAAEPLLRTAELRRAGADVWEPRAPKLPATLPDGWPRCAVALCPERAVGRGRCAAHAEEFREADRRTQRRKRHRARPDRGYCEECWEEDHASADCPLIAPAARFAEGEREEGEAGLPKPRPRVDAWGSERAGKRFPATPPDVSDRRPFPGVAAKLDPEDLRVLRAAFDAPAPGLLAQVAPLARLPPEDVALRALTLRFLGLLLCFDGEEGGWAPTEEGWRAVARGDGSAVAWKEEEVPT